MCDLGLLSGWTLPLRLFKSVFDNNAILVLHPLRRVVTRQVSGWMSHKVLVTGLKSKAL